MSWYVRLVKWLRHELVRELVKWSRYELVRETSQMIKA